MGAFVQACLGLGYGGWACRDVPGALPSTEADCAVLQRTRAREVEDTFTHNCKVSESMERLGITFNLREDEAAGAQSKRPWAEEPAERSAAGTALSAHFFDTVPLQAPWADHPLSPEHPLRTLRVAEFPKELILLVRAVQILKAISDDAGFDQWELARRWRPHALELVRSTEAAGALV